MEALLFFILLVVAFLVLNIIDMIKTKEQPSADGHSPPAEKPLVDAAGRPLHGPALARARAARRAGLEEPVTELPATAERISK